MDNRVMEGDIIIALDCQVISNLEAVRSATRAGPRVKVLQIARRGQALKLLIPSS